MRTMPPPMLLAVAGLLICGALPAEDWPHWRGENRNDITSETSGWDTGAWPLGEPAWTKAVGYGSTSPIVIGDRLFVMGRHDGGDHVYCLDAATGRELWTQQYPSPTHGRNHKGDETFYRGPSSTPAYDRATDQLYTLSIDGDLNCWDAGANGRPRWHLNLHDVYAVGGRPDVGGGPRDYGYTSSPMVHGDWLIVEVGADEGNLMAFDKLTGRRRWTSQSKDPAGHTGGPAPITIDGVPCVAVLTLHRLLVARLDEGHEGETVATYEWQTDYANSIAAPAVFGDSVILTSGYNMSKTARIRIAPGQATKVWETRVFSKVCSPIIHDGHVYFAWRTLRCMDYETGKTKWAGGRFGDDASCLLTGDGRLVVLGKKRIALAESAARSPDSYTELSIEDGVGSSQCWPHVVLSGGRIFAKDRGGNVCCFNLAR